MDNLLIRSQILVSEQSADKVRLLQEKIHWNDRLIGIVGARGTGKTTLLLQQIKQRYGNRANALYLSLDDIFFTDNKLVDVARYFIPRGIDTFFLDEVHKYPQWAKEIKNLYDQYKKIHIVFTGSCITDILRQNTDLSRRSVQFEMPGLSYREYLQFSNIATLQPVSLKDILIHHGEIALDLAKQFKPLMYFSDYLQFGYYPFFLEGKKTYSIRLEQIIKMTLENDLTFIEGFDPANIRKISRLFYILATNVPFKPNISKLSDKIGIHRNTLVQYLHYLEKVRLINSLSALSKSISTLQKPDKIFLENTNFHFALSPENADKGNMRESFFLNQLKNAGHSVSLSVKGDFTVDGKNEFEIGGKNKTGTATSSAKNFWIVNDNIETGALHKIPLWLFGMLY
ncbi:MAG: ATP-binding protein [Chitinophagaceae bacterium]|nr:ATP-binding protein [Chitinophagaceae bacterium]